MTGGGKHSGVAQERRAAAKTQRSAATHHEGDLLAGLRLPADQEDAAAEEDEAQGHQRQGPRLRSKDGADLVSSQVAERTHDHHCSGGRGGGRGG